MHLLLCLVLTHKIAFVAKRIAINGFGRIGRLTFRQLYKMPDVKIVGINDLTDPATLAHLLKYDSAHGIFGPEIRIEGDTLLIEDERITITAIKTPEELWKGLEVDTVLECTGRFRTKELAGGHVRPDGAKRVIISAPGKGKEPIPTIVLGINDEQIDPAATVISNASCSTNCLAPLVKVLDDNFGLKSGAMSTIHAYTADQRLQDAPHSDLRRARAAGVNILPTSTGAADTLKHVLPSIGNKLSAIAYRVPVITGSMMEVNAILEKTPDIHEINEAFLAAAQEEKLKGILSYCTDPIVSTDIVGNTHSCVFDSLLTNVNEGMITVVGWYDNESAYARRLAELAARIT